MAAAGVFGKLQLKDETDLVILDAPASFAKATRALQGVRVHGKFGSISAGFFLGFLTTQAQLERFARGIGRHARGDEVVWMAYPKKTSRRYQSEVDRYSDLSSLGKLGYEPVRMVAIDEDWTAVRFRRAAFIKRMTRSAEYALSKVGKAKTSRGSRHA
jgi:hypothetical protein